MLKEIKEYREEVIQFLKKNNFHYSSSIVNYNIIEYNFKYYKWNHPYQGNWEQRELFTNTILNNIKKLIRPNSNVIDIGAQVGNMSIAFSLFANKVISFEPNPVAYEVLELNSTIHQNIIPYNLACSTKNTNLTFHYSDYGFCNGGYAESLNAGIGVTGHTIPLDVFAVNTADFLKEHHNNLINNISLIKIDAEGHDKNIIPTLKPIITECKPVLITELYDGLNFKEIDELLYVIADLNYECYDERNGVFDINNLGNKIKTHTDISPKSGHNLLCLPK
jgi:FkbM family methyltransferase